MPTTNPQSTNFIGIDPSRQSRFNWWPSTDAYAARRKETRKQREVFNKAHKSYIQYGLQLRKLANHIGDIVNGVFNPNDPNSAAEVQRSLMDYARMIGPWAERLAYLMVAEVNRRDAQAWYAHGRNIGRSLRQELATAPTGPTFAALQSQQVHLIKSLPVDAARRVFQLSEQSLRGEKRWEDISDDIMATGLVTRSRANLIARTESSRATTSFTQVRAEHLGSTGYIWRTVRDRDVRPRHKKLEGRFIPWNDPPEAGERGELAHAGQIYNCRCWPEPVLPEEEPAAKAGARHFSLTYLEALEPVEGVRYQAVTRARLANPRLAQRLTEARERVTHLQAEVHAAARRGDERETERIDRLLLDAREEYDDLGVRFDRLRGA
jgi:SPP1 gp7 family putative phage head morphogenesis protein